ncbi:MAG: hypothetical protein E7617_06210 [Ruminococcaceae bacterium]|nr:hypothetical protein [Oscillospiraceae bacterium]
MTVGFAKRIAALILTIALLCSSFTLLISCQTTGGNTDVGSSGGTNNNGGADAGDNSGAAENEDYRDKITVPEYKEYDRRTVKFSEMKFERPDFAAVIGGFDRVIELIKANEISFEEQIAAIEEIEAPYSLVRSMYAFTNIYNSIDSSDEFWNPQFTYITTNYPTFAGKVEDMFEAAANSPHAERFEKEYFGEGLIENYKDGGTLTEAMIQLWKTEEQLEADYSSISTATVEITYKNQTDTVDRILAFHKDKYGEKSTEYITAFTYCMQEYQKISKEKSRSIYIDLFKVRSLIATELGDDSYMTYAYKSHARDYEPEKIERFLKDIADYIIPVYSTLSYFVFNPFFETTEQSKLELHTLVNNCYSTLKKNDQDLADIFAYMLQFELFDIETEKLNRQDGAFTTYIDDYDAPFIFMTASGKSEDYSTLYHEFGHFVDAFINDNGTTSIDQKEVSSQALEYIMLHYMEDILSDSDMRYLTYKKLSSAMETLIYEGFYARFEALAYDLPYDAINEENLNKLIVKAAEEFKLNTKYVNDISVTFIPHIFLYPFYVQSYCTSLVPALQLYLMPTENGESLLAYKSIIDRSEEDMTFEETIVAAGLSSPFESGVLQKIADEIHFIITGSHFFKNNGSGELAA